MSMADLFLIKLAIGMVGILTWFALIACKRAGLSRRPALLFADVALAWLAATAWIAQSGLLANSTSSPPRVVFVPIVALIFFVSVSRTEAVRLLISSTPASWVLALQSFRILVELALYRLHAEGSAPIQVTFEGRNFDILAGITAVVIAFLVHRGLAGRRLIIGWNIFGLCLLANIAFTAATSVPGPLQLDWPGGPFTQLASWPIVWIPGLLLPTAVFLHIFSIRQALSQNPDLRGPAVQAG